MSDLYKIEKDKDVIDKIKSAEKNSLKNPEGLTRFKDSAKLKIPSIQINNEFHSFAGRRSSIPANLDNFNIHVYNNGRRYSEVILSPTDAFRRDYFKFYHSPINKINDCISDVFGNFTKRLKPKSSSLQMQKDENFLENERMSLENQMSEEEISPRYVNPLEDSYEGNEKISLHSEFLQEDEETAYGKKATPQADRRTQDQIFVTSESKQSSRRNSDEETKGAQQNPEVVLDASSLGSPVAGQQRRDSERPLLRQRASSPISLRNARRRSVDYNYKPSARGDEFQRFPSQPDGREQSNQEKYQDNLKSIVLSYFHLTNSKWDHANVNGTKHWDRRSSRVSVRPIMNSIPKDAFGSRMSVITDECATIRSFNETDKESLLRCSEVEYSSGGLLTVDNEDHPPSAPIRAPDSETLLFSDGKRRIDLVLVFEEQDDGVMNEVETLRKERRRVFRENLEKEGLEFELEDKKGSFDEKTYFLKIHAPWQVMTRYAELMNIKMPIREKDEESNLQKVDDPLYSFFNKLFDYDRERIPDEPSFYKATFTRDREDQFVVKDRETFFTAAQRSQIVWQILMRAKYDATEKVGIRRLLNDQTFLAAFPLHEGRYDADASEGYLFDRRLLYLEWARPSKWYKRQPLWLVRKYFGDKIALYFAWLGFYTYMLTLPAIVGVLCFLYGLGSIEKSDNIPGKEICDQNGVGNLTLCPMCDKACRYLKLGDSCMYAKITYLFDNPATVFFAIFMSFWATMFLELWKRQQSVIVWEWDLQLVEEDEEPRPEFETSVKTFRINPVTREKEPYLPAWSRALRFVATGATVLCMIFVVLGAVLGTIIYRISLVAIIYSGGGSYLKDHAKIFTSMSAAVLNLIIIMILTKFYHHLAIWLTNLENPRTQSEYEDSYTFKIFLFEFVNFYSSLIYIAFFKGRFFMYPGDTDARSSEFLKLKGDVCDPAGCLSELCIQLAIIMIGKQFLNNVLELLYPKFWNWWYHRIHHSNTKKDFKRKLTRWEEDYQMQDAGRLALFEEYLEMVLQYGFVTLFVAAFPLAPLFAFLNNIGEIRLDAYKMVTQSRRPLAERVQNIGAWYGILKGLTYAAVVSNAFVIGYTSDFIPRMVYKFVYSPTHDLRGYIRSSLSEFNTSDYTEDMGSPDDDPDPPICYYRGYRNPPNHPTDPYDLSPQYWHVFAARLAFVVVFEHFVFALTGIMAYIIPDIPAAVKTQMQRERLLAKEAKYERGLHSAGNDEEFLSALRDQNHSRIESILRRGSWGRRFSKYSDELDDHVNVSSSKVRKASNSTSSKSQIKAHHVMSQEGRITSDSPSNYAITWRNLSVSVKIRNRNFFGKNPQPYKRLIINENGAIKTGSLVVLMGPSGAGKSTLMGALAYRNARDVFVEGDVRIDGAPVGNFMHRISGFMHQEDLFVATLTVREHLEFMAKLKLGGVKSHREIKRLVDKSITDMGLTNCTNTRIGRPGDRKAISGGERKRLAFATEVLTDPPILFCDEPTTGLDSFSAQCLVTQMTQMASRGKTILCTIHQPSSELFAMFQQLIFLADGRIVFIGETEAALRFFRKNGYVFPPNYNPAEVIIRALSSRKDDDMSIKRLCDEFSVSKAAREMEETMVGNLKTSQMEVTNTGEIFRIKRKTPSWMVKMYLLTYRSFLQVLRDPSVQIVRILQKLGIALMAGLCFLGTTNLTQAGVQSIQGAIFVLVTENTFPPMYGVLSLFPEEYPLFLREYKNDLYSSHLYYISKLISFLPGLILEPVLFVIVAYLISGLKRTLYAFCMTCTIAILTTNVAAACGCFFSNAFGSVSMALAFLVPIDYTLMVTSGLFIKLSSIPGIISWFQYLSWFMYSNEALSIVQWNGVDNITCEYTNPEIPCLANGMEVLEKFDFSASHMSQNITAMCVLYCIFHVCAYFFLWWKTNKQ